MPNRKSDIRPPKLTIAVTAEIIAKAVRCHSGLCPISQATKQAYPHFSYVSVQGEQLRVTDTQKSVRYVLIIPGAAQAWLKAYDAGFPREPFTFTTARGGSTYFTTAQAKKKREQLQAEGIIVKRLPHKKIVEHRGTTITIGGNAPSPQTYRLHAEAKPTQARPRGPGQPPVYGESSKTIFGRHATKTGWTDEELIRAFGADVVDLSRQSTAEPSSGIGQTT